MRSCSFQCTAFLHSMSLLLTLKQSLKISGRMTPLRLFNGFSFDILRFIGLLDHVFLVFQNSVIGIYYEQIM